MTDRAIETEKELFMAVARKYDPDVWEADITRTRTWDVGPTNPTEMVGFLTDLARQQKGATGDQQVAQVAKEFILTYPSALAMPKAIAGGLLELGYIDGETFREWSYRVNTWDQYQDIRDRRREAIRSAASLRARTAALALGSGRNQ